MFDKTVDDLQSDITVGERGISGTLKYVDDYSSAGYAGDEKSGYFLVIHAEAAEGATITAEITNGDHGEVTLDEDGILITRIKNTQQKIIIKATKTGAETITKTFTLNGLKLA